MFRSLLIANRGEIARRVIRSARALGLRTVAVYSDADAEAAHVAEADEALRLGPAPAAESYLSQAAVIEAARRSGAEAVHPGYGFLSENADFAEACAAAGLVFVGPPPEAIRDMGDKSRAKSIMAEAGVPLVPGYHGAEQSDERLAAAAEEIGYPVLIKAAAGGGGKGMRVVEAPDGFAAALAAARREAKAGFGDERMLIERYLERPRHIEVQVFADGRGNVVHLFERDCSLQRRHQKVLEEAPAPGLDATRRAAMGEAAVAAARAIGYRGAGTVEFVAAAESFYFIEMNTRLQVEHPVTEMVTGQDLVAWQLRVAAGEPLPCGQGELTLEGHAVEVRLYAEDPDRDFLPATGRLAHLRFPPASRHLRIDSGVRQGDVVSPHYDPMLAKLIVWDRDRAAALRRLEVALAATEVLGVTTNVGFLRRLVAAPEVRAAALDTGLIARLGAAAPAEPKAAPDEVLVLAGLGEILRRAADAAARAAASADPHSPWNRTDGWRLNGETYTQALFRDGERERALRLHYRDGGYEAELEERRIAVRAAALDDGRVVAELNGRRVAAASLRDGDAFGVLFEGRVYRLALQDPLALADEAAVAGGALTAPMPGKVINVLVHAGARVKRGEPLIILEAMKMEHTVSAPADGVIEAVHFDAGDLVEEGSELMALTVGESGVGDSEPAAP